MSNRIEGNLSVSIRAGHITATSVPTHPQIGKQVSMSDDLYFHITPDIAKQWIETLTPIAGTRHDPRHNRLHQAELPAMPSY